MKVGIVKQQSRGYDMYRVGMPCKYIDGAEPINKVRGKFIGKKMVGLQADIDVLVLSRPAMAPNLKIIRAAQADGIGVVADIDDDLKHMPPSHGWWQEFQPQYNSVHNWEILHQACKMADVVTATTDELVAEYGYGHGMVVPNFVPEDLLDIEVDKIDKSVGWFGHVEKHPDDLRQVGSAVAQVDCDFYHMGTGDAAGTLGVEGTQWKPNNIGQYWYRMAMMQCGLAPLVQNKFNCSKSWLKGLEYSALGVPWVGSDLPEYRKLYDAGLGQVATRTREWRRGIENCFDNHDELSAEYRSIAADFTIERNYHLFAEAWEKAVR